MDPMVDEGVNGVQDLYVTVLCFLLTGVRCFILICRVSSV